MNDDQLRTKFETLRQLKPTAVIFEHLRDEIVAAVTHRTLQGEAKRVYSSVARLTLFARALCVCSRVALVIVLVVLVGGGATFVAAQAAIPGQFLYPMKLVSEQFAAVVSYSAKGQLRMSILSAQRRADELAVLKLRASTKSVTEKKVIAKAIVSTSQRFAESGKKIAMHFEHSRAIPDTMVARRVIPELQNKVEIFREALKDVRQVSTEMPEIGEAVGSAQAQIESLDALINDASNSTPVSGGEAGLDENVSDKAGAIKAEFEAVQILRAKLSRALEQLPFKGILVPQEIRGDLQIMEDLMREAKRYEEYDKHSEAYGLAKSAQRLGEKVLRQLEELERARLH